MATSTLRFAIIVALIVGGVVLIAQAFPEGPTSALGGSGSTSPSESASQSPAGNNNNNGGGGNGQGSGGAQVRGVKIAVYNGTFQTGLAADTALKLEERFGYKIDHETSILDAESKPVDPTTIYYATPDDKIEAEALANTFFKKLQAVKIAKMPQDFQPPPGVQLAVYVGTDYAALK